MSRAVVERLGYRPIRLAPGSHTPCMPGPHPAALVMIASTSSGKAARFLRAEPRLPASPMCSERAAAALPARDDRLHPVACQRAASSN